MMSRLTRIGRNTAICAGSLAMMAVVAACGGTTTATGGKSGSSQQSASNSGASGSPGSITLGWSQRRIAGSDWYKTLVKGGQQEAKKLGIKLDVLDANGDTTQQNQDINTLISRNVQGIIINANDPLGVQSGILAAKRAKIPVVAVNSNLAPNVAKNTFCYVAENQVATGAKVGHQIALDALRKYKPGSTVQAVAVGGYPGDVLTELRLKGFKQGMSEVLSKNPRIKVQWLPVKYGHWLPDQALAPMRDAASANPNLRIIFNESDVMQSGIFQGLKASGLWGPKLLIGSYDGGMNGIQYMVQHPRGALQADGSNQPYDQGIEAVKMAVAAIKGQTSACPGGTVYIETTLVTPKNAKSYYNPSLTHVRSKNGPVVAKK